MAPERSLLALLALLGAAACVTEDLTGSRCSADGLCGEGYVCRTDRTCAKACGQGSEPCGARCVAPGTCDPSTLDGGGGGADGGGDAGPCSFSETQILEPLSARLPRTQTQARVRLRTDAGVGCPLVYEIEASPNCPLSGGICLAPTNPNLVTLASGQPSLDLALPASGSRVFLRGRGCSANDAGCGPWSRVRVFESGRAPGDLDGDGLADVLIGQDAGSPLVFYGSRSARAPTPVDAGAGRVRSLASVGDFNSDGIGDAVAVFELDGGETYTRTLLCGTSGPVGAGAATFGTSPAAVVALGDINDDGPADYLELRKDLGAGGSPATLVFGPSGTRVALGPIDTVAAAAAALGDVNGDGLRDFAIAGRNATSNIPFVWVYLGRADFARLVLPAESFVLQVSASNSDVVSGIGAVGDLNGDGFDDFFVGGTRGGGSTATFPKLYLGGARAIADGIYTFGVSSAPGLAGAGQLGADPELLFQVDTGGGNFALRGYSLPNTGVQLTYYALGLGVQFGAIGDYDGDGRMELGVTYARSTNSTPIVIYGRPDGGTLELTNLDPELPGVVEGGALATYPVK